MKIVICGSMSKSKEMLEIKAFLEQRGNEVFVPQNTEHYASGNLSAANSVETTKVKIENDLIRKYYELIKNSDAVLVANYDKGSVQNYVGGNSFLEAGYAYALHKNVYFLNAIPDMSYADELRAMEPIILNGDLSKIQ